MPPKATAMAKATTTVRTATTKRKAIDTGDEAQNASKRRRQNGTPPTGRSATELEDRAPTLRQGAGRQAEPQDDEDDAGFTFTRPAAKVKRPLAVPTRSSPRNHAKPATIPTYTGATPRATRPPAAESIYPGLSNASDSFVALPVSDTPIIRKNQQLRQNGGDGRRRSSLSMRGKRASSIGNGFQSLPHPDIPASEFYKHISEDLPDPVRMKQLLAWCARRVLDDSKTRPSLHGKETDEELQAANIARTIEEEVLKDLIDNKITTSWYHQPDQPPESLEKKPHPQNLNNAAKMEEMEEKIAQLEAEEAVWQALLAKHTTAAVSQAEGDEGDAAAAAAAAAPPPPPAEPKERFARNVGRTVDLDLLPAHEAEFVHSLSARRSAGGEGVRGNEDWLREGETNLEFQIDSMLQSLHQQRQYLRQADATGGRLLEAAATAMAAAEKQGRLGSEARGIGTLDVLRQLSRTSRG